LEHHAARAPARPAYIDAAGCLSFGDLWLAARRHAATLAQLGVRQGEVVAFACEEEPHAAHRALEVFYGLASLGAVLLPLYPEVPEAAGKAMMRRVSARWLVARGAPPFIEGARGLDLSRFDAVPAGGELEEAPRGDRREAGVLYGFTSGTSGAPKVLLFTHAQLHDNSLASALAIGMDAQDRQMAALPWPSLVAMRHMMRAHAVGAAYVGVELSETREELALDLARHGVTRLSLSPWQLRRLLGSPAPASAMPPLRSLQTIGAFAAPEEVEAARAANTPNVFVGYGCNEIGSVSLLAPGQALPGCVGTLVPGMQWRVEDEHGQALPAGATGALGFRAAWMCTGYEAHPEATRRHFRNGWFFPGDVGCVDAQNRVWLRGRNTEVINYGGLKIWPEDIETVLKRHPAVADAAVAGVPDPMAGQLAVAFVVVRGQLTDHELRDFCAQYLEPARIPRHFFGLRAIARNAAGKALREQMVAAHAHKFMGTPSAG
jgi:acyl-CoA synthetase (AMP-forming)/AMP-acid ligase II